jgi:hypothetical protein
MLNIIASKPEITGWYDFLTRWWMDGAVIFKQLSWKDYLWLFFIYPLLLGLICKWGMQLLG